FPTETVLALQDERLLSVLVPEELGGAGATVSEVGEAVASIGRHCASSAMVLAMHQLQVACLVRHGHTPTLRAYLRRVSSDQLLLASATTEAGVGGDLRTSVCTVEREGEGFRLEKSAPVISYGEQADAILVTARRAPDSPPNDQVLVLCSPPGLLLEPTSGWDAMGFRGTCSLGFQLRARGSLDAILPDPFSDISAQTMLPVSHVLWSFVWLGLAGAAVERARRFVQGEARKRPGVTPPSATRLAELTAVFQQMSDLVHGAARRYEEAAGAPGLGATIGYAISMNALKVSASTLVVDVVGRAMAICGMAGYREDSPLSLGRLLRDAYGAALMVNNDRILANNAQMLLVHKES
ncbi:MAG: acyl-CoA dehydrogenase family protein, partial [Acidimicrobiales bacterium]